MPKSPPVVVTADLLGAQGPEYAPTGFRDAAINLLTPFPMAVSGYHGALYLLLHFNNGELLDSYAVRRAMSLEPAWINFSVIGEQLDVADPMTDDIHMGEASRMVLALCCAMDFGRPVSNLHIVLRRLHLHARLHLLAALALCGELVNPRQAISPLEVPFAVQYDPRTGRDT